MGVSVASDGDDDYKEECGPAAPSKSLDSLAAEATMASVEADGYTETCMTANPAAFAKYSNDVDGNNSSSSTEGEIKSQQDRPPVPSPPAGVVRNPIS